MYKQVYAILSKLTIWEFLFESNSLTNMIVALLMFQGMVVTVASGWPQVLLSSSSLQPLWWQCYIAGSGRFTVSWRVTVHCPGWFRGAHGLEVISMYCNCSLGTLPIPVTVGFDNKQNEWFANSFLKAIWGAKCQLLDVGYMYVCIKCDHSIDSSCSSFFHFPYLFSSYPFFLFFCVVLSFLPFLTVINECW